MEKKSVINFSSFYEGNTSKRKPFDKNSFSKPLFKEIVDPINESENTPKKQIESEKKSITEKNIENTNKVSDKEPFRRLSPINEIVEKVESEKDEMPEYPEVVDDVVEEPELDDAFDPPVDPEEFVIDNQESIEQVEEEEYLPSLDNDNNYNKVDEVDESFYSVFKDKFETFTCNIMVEGAKLNETKARLVLESDDWNIVFDGEIDENGKCSIPMKRLNILDEGAIGKIRLEVIAENTIFSPWEDDFKVRVDKKVAVQVPKKKLPKEPSVKVKFGKK